MTIRVMIIHASRVLRTALGNLIEQQQGFRVAGAAGSVDDALNMFNRTPPDYDLILVDSGLAVSGSVEKLQSVSRAKIMMIAADETDAALDGWIKEGARGIIGVDADVSHLIKAMSKVYEGEYWLNRQVTSRILSSLGQYAKELTPEQLLIKSLTAKEKDVARAILRGNGETLRATAQALEISENTLRNHLTSVYSKLKVANRTELFIFAQQYLD